LKAREKDKLYPENSASTMTRNTAKEVLKPIISQIFTKIDNNSWIFLFRRSFSLNALNETRGESSCFAIKFYDS